MTLQKISVIAVITFILSACGQSGGLYLPKNPPPSVANSQEKNK